MRLTYGQSVRIVNFVNSILGNFLFEHFNKLFHDPSIMIQTSTRCCNCKKLALIVPLKLNKYNIFKVLCHAFR